MTREVVVLSRGQPSLRWDTLPEKLPPFSPSAYVSTSLPAQAVINVSGIFIALNMINVIDNLRSVNTTITRTVAYNYIN